MPKNKGKGGKNRRRGKNESEVKRELVFKQPGQEYAQVVRMLGNGRLEAFCFDGKNRLCHIRGKMRKRVWVNQGDIILLGLRDFQNDKADVILKYNEDEARRLKKMGELPMEAKINDVGDTGDPDNKVMQDEVPFDFTGGGKNGDSSSDERDTVGTQPDRYKPMSSDDTSDEDSDDNISLNQL